MEKETKRIIEINGIKLEVDLRDAKRIDQFKVGDHIKVLVKNYSEKYDSYIGQIIGFDNFEKLPTIVVAYLKTDYGSATIEFVHINAKTEEVEITQLNDWDVPLTKSDVLRKFNKDIEVKKQEVKDLEGKKNVFLKLFGKYFDEVIKPE